MLFYDRRQAGQRLAWLLSWMRQRSDLIVLGLPSGGIPVAYEVARAIEAPLDVFMVRTLAVPGHDELTMGAIASGGTRIVNASVVELVGVPEVAVEEAVARATEELARSERAYRGDRPPLDLRGRSVIVIDEGVAVGSPMRLAVRALREGQASRVVVAAPVAASSIWTELRAEADEVVCVHVRAPFLKVGTWYANFSPVTDEQVRTYLAVAAGVRRQGADARPPPRTG